LRRLLGAEEIEALGLVVEGCRVWRWYDGGELRWFCRRRSSRSSGS
jgi:hypothetical protein